MLIKEASTIWNRLNGIICVYKPVDFTCHHVRKIVISKICSELNEFECRPPIQTVEIEGNPLEKLSVTVQPSLADDPMVIGPRYQYDDLRCSWSSFLGRHTSGVLLLGLRRGTKIANITRQNRLARAYRLKGILGQATDTYYKDGKVVEKSTYKHVKSIFMDNLLASMQAAHQRKMFELSGVDMQSQAAYELAIQGPLRPSNSKTPLLYGIKCVHFESPEFTLEVHCINEYEMYLKTLVHEIGMKLHSTAHCTGIQCIRHSYFSLDMALLKKHWNLQNIVGNMNECASIINSHEDFTNQKSAVLHN